MSDTDPEEPVASQIDDQVFSSFTISLFSDQGTVELEDALPPAGLVATLRELGQRLLDLADYCEVEGVQALLGGDEGNDEDEAEEER